MVLASYVSKSLSFCCGVQWFAPNMFRNQSWDVLNSNWSMTLENKAATSFCVTIFSLQFSKGPCSFLCYHPNHLFFETPRWNSRFKTQLRSFFSCTWFLVISFWCIEVIRFMALGLCWKRTNCLVFDPNPSETYARQNGYIYIIFFSPKFWGENIHNLGNHPPRKDWPKTKSSLSMLGWQTLVTVLATFVTGIHWVIPIVVCLFPGDLSSPRTWCQSCCQAVPKRTQR